MFSLLARLHVSLTSLLVGETRMKVPPSHTASWGTDRFNKPFPGA